ncbi:helix-turn-helix domain-containing protein [Sphingobium sp.]|uniref:helix-turn-helix domain-containing protein n=1 Tax=Sphingobium sp. TaxID=1912891 RepID=UPI0028BDC5B6|nr:helix-turn-helix domain-containing protein [Sphingobium sp.]
MITDIFSTDSLATRSGLARKWEDANRRLVGLELTTKPHGSQFHASTHIYSSRRLRFSSLRVSSHVTTLGAIRDPGIDPYHMIACIKEGDVIVGQDGREAHLETGDFVIVDTSRPFQIDTPSMFVHSVNVLSSRLREIFPQVDGLTAVAISGQTAPAAVLRGVLENMFEHATRISDDASDYIADAVYFSAASTLCTLPAARDMLPDKIESMHRHRIRSHVRANLRNRDLNPEMIARTLDLPVRYLHKLFEDEPVTLMKWVWAERIARCLADLSKPELRNRTIGEIAYSWGFSDPAHFSRLFKRQIGISPSAIRRDCN